MEIRKDVRPLSGRVIALAIALLAVLAIVLAARQLAAPGATSVSPTRSGPVPTTNAVQHYLEPDARDRNDKLRQPTETVPVNTTETVEP
jgi:hypothetical protein